MNITKVEQIPSDLYICGTNPKGGRTPKYPLVSMEPLTSFTSILGEGKEVSRKRGQLMAAIRATSARYPSRQYGVKEVTNDSGAKCLEVYRMEDKPNQ